MGKQKRGRQKFHLAATKSKQDVQQKESEKMEVEATSAEDVSKPVFNINTDNIFKNLKIDHDQLKQKLPADFDTRSAITSKSLKGLNLKKKDKKKLRREYLVQKLDAVESAKKAAKERKRKQQTPIVGDIGLLGDALPTLDVLLKSDAQRKKDTQVEKRRSIPKEKKRQKQMLNDIAVFQQVLKHPSFKENPGATIHEHLQNKLKQEETMDS